MVVGRNIAFKTAAKPLQIETWLLLTAYNKSPSLYAPVTSPISYDAPFSYNARVTDRRNIIPKSWSNGRLKTGAIINKVMQIFTKVEKYLNKFLFQWKRVFIFYFYLFFFTISKGNCLRRVLEKVDALHLSYFVKIWRLRVPKSDVCGYGYG